MSVAHPERSLRNMKLTRKYHLRYMGLWIVVNLAFVGLLNVVTHAFLEERRANLARAAESPLTESLGAHTLYLPAIAVETVCVSLLIVFMAMLTAHRLAGPYLRLRGAFREVGDGNMDYRLKFRKYDRLESVEKSFNEMVESVRRRLCEAQPAASGVGKGSGEQS